ncbi:MAG TPA: glycosyltransferase family 39 protein [Candidatus Didemnitutus sp.]|nr:glycosyltransferase family 39 protein [Candidatus Didemnitutus sp.]
MTLLVLNGIVALVLGFLTLTPDQSLAVIIHGGYWAMLVLTILFGWSLYKVLRKSFPGWQAFRAAPKWPAALIVLCGIVLLVHEAYGFKILMDEVMLLGTSMSMHFEKTALVPMRANDIQGAFQIVAGQLDKRPLFQPFLVSVIHDLTGYRPENVFVLNTGLTFVLLTLAYRLGLRLAGRLAGAAGVLLLTGLPLLAQNATGGGFEILNLVMILSTVLLGIRFAEDRDGDSLQAFCLSGVLLAQTRYESVLFLLPVAALILWVWWAEERPILSWVFVFAPLYLLPYALHNKVFSVREASWEMASKPGFDHPFALSYIPGNIQSALKFFFTTTGEQSNSIVLSVLGFIALPFFLLWAVNVLRTGKSASPVRIAVAIFGFGFLAHTLLMMVYFWGKFDDPVIRRLSLPLNLWLALSIVVALAELSRDRRWPWAALLVVSVGGLFAYSLPNMARHDYSMVYFPGRETQWRRDFIAAHPERDYLVIDNSSITWITHLVSSTPVRQALDRKDSILYNFRNHTFTSMYVFQNFKVDDETGREVIHPEDDLGPDYQLEKVEERRFAFPEIARISRVVSIREGPLTKPRPEPDPIEKLTPDQLEKVRQAYFEKFIKQLP